MSETKYARILAIINADDDPPGALADFVAQECAAEAYRVRSGMEQPLEERAARARANARRTPLISVSGISPDANISVIYHEEDQS